MDDKDRARLDQAHLWAKRVHDFLYEKADGAPRDEPTNAEWFFLIVQSVKRWGWVRRIVLIYGPAVGGGLVMVISYAEGGMEWLTRLLQ